jgi:hypothetical protein
MPRTRYQPPDSLPGATDYSKDDTLRGSLNTVRLVKAQRWVWDDLRDACAAVESNYARRREPGHWELVAIAFVASRHVDIQPFWDESSDELWRECGFPAKPPYLRVWRRLRELESVCDDDITRSTNAIFGLGSPHSGLLKALRKTVHMARPGFEPGTPRFSVVCSTN